MKKKVLALALCLAMSLALCTACGSSSNSEKKTIVIGTSSVSKDLAYSGKKALEDKGYKVKIKVFDDYVTPNDSLVEGSTDANLYQHEPYMENYNKSKDASIIMLKPKLWNYYSGIYSTKADSLEDLPDGGNVGIAEDAANIDTQLRQLQEAGLIKLSDKPASGELYKVSDVVSNPHNYNLITGGGNKYQNMDDFTLIIGTSNTMAEAGVDPTKHLLKKFVDNDLAEGMCVLKKNKDEQWVKDLMEAYTSKDAQDYVKPSTGFEYYGK